MARAYLRTRHALTPALRPMRASGSSPTVLSKRHASTESPSSSPPPPPLPPPPPPPPPSPSSRSPPRIRTFFYGTAAAALLTCGYLYATDTRASLLHQYAVPRLMRLLYPDSEDAHRAGVEALRTLYSLGLHPRERESAAADGGLGPGAGAGATATVFGVPLANPIGISAGLDKDADVPDALFALGAGVVEVGGCTPRPQEGNPRPRCFRVPALDALVNRYGLNSRGADAMAARLRARSRVLLGGCSPDELELQLAGDEGLELAVPRGSLRPGRLLLVQIAKNKATAGSDVEAVASDYVECVRRLAPYADVLVVNVSSPNTPGLRDLQATEPLTRILSAVVDEAKGGAAPRSGARGGGGAGSRQRHHHVPRVMVKVSPDEDDDSQMDGVVQAVWTSGVDGVIVGNTTKRHDGLVPPSVHLMPAEQSALMEEGGFSGPVMFGRTLALVKRYRKMLDEYALASAAAGEHNAQAAQAEPERKVIFASGGITNGKQALQVLNAGASVAMVYTALVYGGSGTVTRIKREMKEMSSPDDSRK